MKPVENIEVDRKICWIVTIYSIINQVFRILSDIEIYSSGLSFGHTSNDLDYQFHNRIDLIPSRCVKMSHKLWATDVIEIYVFFFFSKDLNANDENK